MTGIKYIAEQMGKYEGCPIELTPKRASALRSYLRDMQQITEVNSRIGDDDFGDVGFRPSVKDIEIIGGMEFLLNRFFPDGKIPKSLQKPAQFVHRTKFLCRNNYDEVVDAKLRRDEATLERALKEKDTLDEADDRVYARAFVNVIEAEESIDRRRIIVMYGEDVLYEDNLPEGVFEGLSDKAAVVFDYTDQRLALNLGQTLEESVSHSTSSTKVERVVIENLAKDMATKKYLDSLFDQLNTSAR